MQVGIFQGKKVKYNKLIFKALHEEGYLSAWQIAKYISKKDPERRKRNWYHEAQKVYSVLIRKNGRLEELVNKEYVQKTPRGYRTTYPKGYCLALTLFQDVRIPKIDVFDINLLLQGAKAQYPTDDVDTYASLKEMLEIYTELYSKEEGYRVLAKATSALLDLGLNLDALSNEEFRRFLESHLEIMWQKELEQGKTWNKMDENPELRKRAFNLMLKLRKKMKEQWKELEKTLDSIEDNLRKLEKKG